MPIEIYFWPTPNGHKVTIACEEMGLEYVIKPFNVYAVEKLRIKLMRAFPQLLKPDERNS